MTRGYPLAIIVYRVRIFYIVRNLRESYPEVKQPLYDNNDRLSGNFASIKSHLKDLEKRGTYKGYFPNLTKIILVVSDQNVQME